MDSEIDQFTKAIGAKAPRRGDKVYEPFRILFKRPNYFVMSGTAHWETASPGPFRRNSDQLTANVAMLKKESRPHG
jgi:hypothetical protein